MSDEGQTQAPSELEVEHPLIGHVLSERYRIDALIGEGGMGAVFRATHLSLERPVAVKVLHPALTDDQEVCKRFDREALAVSKLDHPGCVQVLDFGTTRRGMKYLVMQYLEGHELTEWVGVPRPVPQVIDIGEQVLSALEHAHKRGLVHRDLKPENIFVVSDDEGRDMIKLVDFGIVKLLEGAGLEKLTQMGMAFGTPAYMSPEQAAGGVIDTRSDLYALGVLLYELLCGTPPFDAAEPGVLLRMHIMTPPPPLPVTVPPALAEVVMMLLRKDADDRYQTARQAKVALSEADPRARAKLQPPVAPSAPVTPELGSAGSPSPVAPGIESARSEPALSVERGGAARGGGDTEPMVPVRTGGTLRADSADSVEPEVRAIDEGGSLPASGSGHTEPSIHSAGIAAVSYDSGALSNSQDLLSVSGITPSSAFGAPPSVPIHRQPDAPKRHTGRQTIVLLVGFAIVVWGIIALVWFNS